MNDLDCRHLTPSTATPYEQVVILDMDSTIADDGHRKHHIVDPSDITVLKPDHDWDAYFEHLDADPCIQPMKRLVNLLAQEHPIFVVTGRQNTVRQQTIDWLKKHGIPHSRLFMRPKGDHRSNAALKVEILKAIEAEGFEILLALEDSESVAFALREAGYFVLRGVENPW